MAIVTAAGQGIGAGIATLFAREGAKVLITGRTVSKLETVADRIRAEGGDVRMLEALAGDREDAGSTVREAIDSWDRLDILVNNAHSFTDPAPVENIAEENIRINMETGLIGSLQLMQLVFPHLCAAGGGSIINLGSSFGYRCEAG